MRCRGDAGPTKHQRRLGASERRRSKVIVFGLVEPVVSSNAQHMATDRRLGQWVVGCTGCDEWGEKVLGNYDKWGEEVSADISLLSLHGTSVLSVALGQHLFFRQAQLADVPVSFSQSSRPSTSIGAPANAPISPTISK